MAAEHESGDRAAEELSQLIYWIQLMMISRGLTPADVYVHPLYPHPGVHVSLGTARVAGAAKVAPLDLL